MYSCEFLASTREWNIHRTGAGVDKRMEDLDTDVGTLKYLTEHAQYL